MVDLSAERNASCGFVDLNFTFYGRAPWLWKNMICHARK